MSPRPARPGFFVVSGPVKPDALSYVTRAADHELHAALKRGEYCYILDSRQTGKSSLVVRTAERLRHEGAKAAVIHLASLSRDIGPEQWYMELLARIGVDLDLVAELQDYWDRHTELSAVQRWLGGIRDVVLPHTNSTVVIFLDEIDLTQSLSFSASEFFAGIGTLYMERGDSPRLDRLVFCLLGVTTPADLIEDVRATPFILGRRIELPDFTDQEAQVLLPGFRHTGDAGPTLLKRILHWTGGHPYLTQRLCQAVCEDPRARSASGVDKVCTEKFLSDGAYERDENLLFVHDWVLHNGVNPVETLSIYSNILAGLRVNDDPAQAAIGQLRLSGVVKVNDGVLRVRNRIYERVFGKDFVESNQPLDELQRQHAAERRGRVLVLKWALPVVVGFAALALLAWVQTARAQRMAATLKANAESGMTTSSAIANRLYVESNKEPAFVDDYVRIVGATSQFAKSMLGVEPRNVAALNLKAYAGYVAAHQAVQRGDKTQALKLAEQSATDAKGLEKDSDVRIEAIAARSYAAAADTLGRLGDSAKAESSAQKAETLVGNIAKALKPEDDFTLQLVTETYGLLASAEESMDHWEHAVEAYQHNLGKQPDSNATQNLDGAKVFQAAHAALDERNQIAKIEFENNQREAARKVLEERSLRIARTLVDWNEKPDQNRSQQQRTEAWSDLWHVQDMLGFVLASQKSTLPDALQYYSDGLVTGEKVVHADPSSANREKLEDAVVALARTQKLLGLSENALHDYVRYVALERERAEKEPGAESSSRLGSACRHLADFEYHHGNRAAAPADYQCAVEWLSKAGSAHPEAQQEIATASLRLADLDTDSGSSQAKDRYRDAIRASERRIETARRDQSSRNPYAAHEALFVAYQSLALARAGIEDRKGAGEALVQSLEAARTGAKLAQKELDRKRTWEAIRRASSAYSHLGWIELLNGHPDESIRDCRTALELNDQPAWMYANLAHAELFSKQLDQARTLYLAHRGEEMYDDPFEISVQDDFAKLRKLGLDQPAMAEIEQLLGGDRTRPQ